MAQLIHIVVLLTFAGVAVAAPGEAPARLVDSPLSAESLVDTGLGLVVVLALMLGMAWLVKRYVQVPGIGRGQVQILGGASLGAREKAVLVSVGGRRLLLGVAPGRVQTLLVLDEDGTPSNDFADQLKAAKAVEQEPAS